MSTVQEQAAAELDLTDSAVHVDGVTKTFGDFKAVDDIHLEIPRGSLFGILGSNGAGKTTTIRMIMNIFRPDRGTVRVLGEPASEELKARLGYLPEERGLYKRMRIEEMLLYFGQIKGRRRDELLPRIDRWLEAMGLAEWRKRRVDELSKGMSQKLQFVSTVVHGPELLVLDEPFAGLDPVNRDVLRDAVLALHREGMTILFSTHVMEQAEQLCRDLALIHRGQVRLHGTTEAVKASEGRQAAHIRYRLRDGFDLEGLPGVQAISGGGNEAELTLAPDSDTDALLAALIERTHLTRFDLREPSLHEIFKRVVGGES